MASWTKFQDFSEQLAEGNHDFDAHTYKVALTNTAPNAATNTVISDITEITATGGYSAGGEALAGVTSNEAAGTYTFDANDTVFTATGAGFGPFRYPVLYNSTNNRLVAYSDHGSAISITGTYTIQWGASGIMTIT